MITYFNVLWSYRRALMTQFGVHTDVMYHGIELPTEFPRITLRFTDGGIEERTKLGDLSMQDMTITLGLHHDTLRGLNSLYRDVKSYIMLNEIPLLDDNGDEVGKIQFDNVFNEQQIEGGDFQRETVHHRVYIDYRINIAHIKY